MFEGLDDEFKTLKKAAENLLKKARTQVNPFLLERWLSLAAVKLLAIV